MRWKIAALVFGEIAVIGVLLFAGGHRHWWISLLVAVAIGVALVVFSRQLHALHRSAPKAMASVAALELVAGLAAIACWWLGAPAGAAYLGVIAAYFGMGHLLGVLRGTTIGGPRRGEVLMTVLGVVGGAALVVVTLDLSVIAAIVAGACLLAVPIALSLLSEDVIEAPPEAPEKLAKVWPVLPAVAAIVGVFWLWRIGMSLGYLAIVTIALVGIIFAIATDTSADVAAVALVVVLVWSTSPKESGSLDITDPARGEHVMVVIGDSFISGEGAKEFLPGTNTIGENTCRRAPTAHPLRVVQSEVDGVPRKVVFLACSGAKAAQVVTEHQNDGGATWPTGVEPPADTDISQLAELEHIVAALDLEVDLVLVSIGGNDASFGTIGRVCVAPGNCAELGGFWLDGLPAVEETLVSTYRAIRESPAIPATTKIVVVPYPVPIAPAGCDTSIFTEREHRFLHGFTEELNETVFRAAGRVGVPVVDTIPGVFEANGSQICGSNDDPPAVNKVVANPVRGFRSEQVNPLNWFRSSLHPTAEGHAQMAIALETWLREHLGDPPLEPTEPSSAPRRTIGDIMGDPDVAHCAELDSGLPTCRSTATYWAAAGVLRKVWYALPGVLLLGWGSWVLSVRVIRSSRVRRVATAQ